MDTLYFELDEDYMMNGNNFRNLKGEAFNRLMAKKMKSIRTNGYIYYLVDTILPLSDTPDIKSLKNYIENEVFYYEGEYNEIINEYTFKYELLDKHQILFVQGDTILVPGHIQYNSFYPIGKGAERRDPRKKDTLVFSYDENVLRAYPQAPLKYYFSDHQDEGAFYFEELAQEKKSNSKLKARDFSEFISRLKTRYSGISFRGLDIYNYLKNYVVYLLKDNEYIFVKPCYEVE